MKSFIASLMCVLPVWLGAQQIPEPFRSRNKQVLVYRTNADQAALFHQRDSIPLQAFAEATPYKIESWYVDQQSLPPGQYVSVKVSGLDVETELFSVSQLQVISINDKRSMQVAVRTTAGNYIENAKVYFNKRQAVYQAATKTYKLPRRRMEEEGVVMVFAPGDTTFTYIAVDDYSEESLSSQRSANFRQSGIFKVLSWFPNRVSRLIQGAGPARKRFRGYMVFSQPRYKPGDTVKYKAYLYKAKSRKPYHRPLTAWLQYNHRQEMFRQSIATLQPAAPGSYHDAFVLSDTLPMDQRFELILKDRKGRELFKDVFKTEDYLLEEIDEHRFTANKETYYRNDSLHFTASARDANGLPLLNARLRLLIKVSRVDKFYTDTLFIRDSVYYEERKLQPSGDTKFVIPASMLPPADAKYSATLQFLNSNNEVQDEEVRFSYRYRSKEIFVEQIKDSLFATYIEDGVPVLTAGLVEVDDLAAIPISFPYAGKIDPIAEEYAFYTLTADSTEDLGESVDVQRSYDLGFERVHLADSIGFILSNPYKVPLYFSVFDGKRLIGSGMSSTEQVRWMMRPGHAKKTYQLRWQYHWAGEEHTGAQLLGVPYQTLNIAVKSQASVYPGQEDSLHILVTDHRGKPAPNVNLTAVSYNNQFGNKIQLKPLPVSATYRSRRTILYDGLSNEKDYTLLKKYAIGMHTWVVSRLSLDTLAYYRLLFPEQPYTDIATPISSYVPQLSVNVVKAGVPQPIHLLYINRQLVYYSGTTDSAAYAFETFPLNVHLGIRLRDRYLEIDSLYMQPGYKHDLSIDLDHLPPHSKVTEKPVFWEQQEMNLLEQSILQMDNDPRIVGSFVWQHNRVTKLVRSQAHVLGPFAKGELTAFVPGNFDISFPFEANYRTQISKKLVRLEKDALFGQHQEKHFLPQLTGRLLPGDTLLPVPTINYAAPFRKPRLNTHANSAHYFSQAVFSKAALEIHVPSDTTAEYIVLQPVSQPDSLLILPLRFSQTIRNIEPGKYHVMIISTNFQVAAIKDISLRSHGVQHLLVSAKSFLPNAALIDSLSNQPTGNQAPPPVQFNSVVPMRPRVTVSVGGGSIRGQIMDASGNLPVGGAIVQLSESGYAVMTDANGNYLIDSLPAANYAVQVSSVGYEPNDSKVSVHLGRSHTLNVRLKVSSQALQEVIVTGYGTMLRRDLTGSLSLVESDYSLNTLEGRLLGVQVVPGASAGTVRVRGVGTLKANHSAYLVDGIFYSELPSTVNDGNISSLQVLEGNEATALYGSRAADGLVVITTSSPTFRKVFRDYAFWLPQLATDRQGNAVAAVQYPDNVTGWRTYVVGMDKRFRAGRSISIVQAYKPVTAELAVPQFLVAGDSTYLVARTKNYTADNYNVQTQFVVGSQPAISGAHVLPSNDAQVQEYPVAANGADTLTASYAIETSVGFHDGEERRIPVIPQGTEEAIGQFNLLRGDTVVQHTVTPGAQPLQLYVQNNTLDLLLEELDHLGKYPYACMEQTASKLLGLLMERSIRKQLEQPFKREKQIQSLLNKLQKSQHFDGSWSWWQEGKADFYITNYITNVLIQLPDDATIVPNLRSAFLYLQNSLSSLNQGQRITSLATLSNGGHALNYAERLQAINFDSLSLYHQWSYVRIRQQQRLPYADELKKLLARKQISMLGSIHWGSENLRWYDNETATTVLAFRVLQQHGGYGITCNAIVQYFLEMRRGGYWRNTVEAASIVQAVLPYLLQQQPLQAAASIRVTGDTSFIINTFPFAATIRDTAVKHLQFNRSGGGISYLTTYQTVFKKDPQPVSGNFTVQTKFFRANGEQVYTLDNAGAVTMRAVVEVAADAEYVMVEVPIPAGCTYGEKPGNGEYREYYKDKVIIFRERLSKGTHAFEISLQCRYRGSYQVNPAKASLMYFPTFFGRNGTAKIAVR